VCVREEEDAHGCVLWVKGRLFAILCADGSGSEWLHPFVETWTCFPSFPCTLPSPPAPLNCYLLTHPPQNVSHPEFAVVVVMVHNRSSYLVATLRSLRAVRGIEHALLVVSRDVMGGPVDAVVDAVSGVRGWWARLTLSLVRDAD